MRQRIDLLPSSPNISPPVPESSNPDNNKDAKDPEAIRQRIERVQADLKDLNAFYNTPISPLRSARFKKYYTDELASLRATSFTSYVQQDKIDYLLLKNKLKKSLRELDFHAEKDRKMEVILPFASTLVGLCEDRQQMKVMDAQKAAGDVHAVLEQIKSVSKEILEDKVKMEKTIAYRAASFVEQLRLRLQEWFGFYQGYDPIFSWWLAAPYPELDASLTTFASLIKEHLVGVRPGDADAIIGDPLGRAGLLADIAAEMIPYTPEELIEIGEKEYLWCLSEMKSASSSLGYSDWHAALEHVKNLYVAPGQQPQLVQCLAAEATEYVKKNDLITIPPIAEETWRTFMMTPAAQKVNPFFLGGDDIIVSYPHESMSHADKLMIMRGNNIHFSRSTVFHELLPGHHLQFYHISRYKSYRQMFDTPFWMEGWALYWEFLLWDRGFPATPENKIGMLFWRMHRCIRIVFSIKFHLGLVTPQECVDMLVDRVGHERATAEGEVKRSFNGEYTPLYQAGYMLGALQIYALRREVVEGGIMGEKVFHDRVMRENEMPIEMLRALILEEDVTEDFETRWKFYDGI